MVTYLSPNNHKHNDIVNRVLKGETYESIGYSWGISRERIRQIVSKYNVKPLLYKDRPLNKEEKYILNILKNKPKLSYIQITEEYNIPYSQLQRIARKANVEWIRYPIYKRKIQSWDYIVDSNTGCWNWNHSVHYPSGYGRIYNGNKIEYAHRYIFQEYVREIMSNEIILHTCNNKLCINPKHLKLSNR